MEMSESIGELAAALAKSQAVMRHAPKLGVNPHFKSRYADLAGVIDACREALAANGVAVFQPVTVEGKTVTVRTVLAHSSGQWMACAMSAEARAAGPQEIGSVVTYLRRYGLAAMAGVASDDDDGEAASGRPSLRREAPADKAARQAGHHPSWEGERASFCAKLGEMGTTYEEVKALMASTNRPKPSEMDSARRAALLAWLGGDDAKARLAALRGGG